MTKRIFTASNGQEIRVNSGIVEIFDGVHNELEEYDYLDESNLTALREFFAWQDSPPWHDAKEGDVWVLHFKGAVLSPEAYSFQGGVFKPTSGRNWTTEPTNPSIDTAEKLWPRD